MTLKKRILILFLGGIFILFYLFFPINNSSFAQQTEIQYPAIWDLTPPATLVGWIHYVLKLLMFLGIIFALVQLVWAGIKYLFAAIEPAQKQDAKDRIEKSIIGLVFLFFFYVILNTLSPMFVNPYLKIPETPAAGGDWGIEVPIINPYRYAYPSEFLPDGVFSGRETDGVPHFRQCDSQWGSVKIGTKTICQVGCFITSIAMVVSYFEDRYITPDETLTTLKSHGCISGNSVRCFTDFDSSLRFDNDNFSYAQTCLDSGGKVIVKAHGAAYTSSGTHFFVLTGYDIVGGKIYYHVNDPTHHTPTADGIITPQEALGINPSLIYCVERR